MIVALFFLGEKLCAPVGGILTHPVNNTATGNATTGQLTPTPSPFTGGTAHPWSGNVAGMVLGSIAIVVGLLML